MVLMSWAPTRKSFLDKMPSYIMSMPTLCRIVLCTWMPLRKLRQAIIVLIFNVEVAYNYHNVCDVVGGILNSQTSLRKWHKVIERKWHSFVNHWHVRGCGLYNVTEILKSCVKRVARIVT